VWPKNTIELIRNQPFIYWQNFMKRKILILKFEIEVILNAFNYQKVRKKY